MANKFTRNITNVKNILKQSLNTNNQNDLLSDDNHAYIRNKNEYHCLTDNVKSVNGVKADEKNEVVIPIGIEELNGSNRPSQKITILDSEGNDIVPSEKEYNLGMEHIYQLPKNDSEKKPVYIHNIRFILSTYEENETEGKCEIDFYSNELYENINVELLLVKKYNEDYDVLIPTNIPLKSHRVSDGTHHYYFMVNDNTLRGLNYYYGNIYIYINDIPYAYFIDKDKIVE